MKEPYYKTHEPPHCPTCDCGMPRDDAAAALGLLARMRFSCGDNGKRMQDELEDYLRELRKDAERYRWLVSQTWAQIAMDFRLIVRQRSHDDVDSYGDAIDAAMNGANG